ncbi:FAD-binding oxidoreductase [Rhizocola hellebori]|nr:FAD-binding oxidoreductase [Rhizocola hellebori]
MDHSVATARLQRSYSALPADSPVRLAKRTSNLFRFRAGDPATRLDVSEFGKVLKVDARERTADVQGMTTYEDLVAATLAHGLMPYVVPQLKTITIGGAVTGLGIESTSFKHGLPHESVLEMEILTGDGRIVIARPDNEHAALFDAFPNSYGTLGYALRLKIELLPVKPYVKLRHVRFDDAEQAFAALVKECANESNDFVDGTVFSRDEIYLTLAEFTDEAPATSDYTGMDIYYRSLQTRQTDYLTVSDYLWRWDTDWFWCSRAFGVQNKFVRALWPRRYRRSDTYHKIVAFDRKHRLTDRVRKARGQQAEEPVVQDVEVPVGHAAEFLDFFHREVGITPVWLCPLRLRGSKTWPLYPLEPESLYVNFGFWSSVSLKPGMSVGYYNRLIEDEVTSLGGHKSLYSTVHYGREEFWRLYHGDAYAPIKAAYDPAGRLPDLYTKCTNAK